MVFGIIQHCGIYLEIAKNPFENVFGLNEKNTIFTAAGNPYLAYLIGIKSKFYFFIFHLFIAISTFFNNKTN